jgi:hypothetical protein
MDNQEPNVVDYKEKILKGIDMPSMLVFAQEQG